MVRLKDDDDDLKSHETKFQFHMVRLKVGHSVLLLNVNHGFNSTWYD